MDSKLVKLIDYSLLPFALTILGKAVGLYVTLQLLGIDWGVGDFNNSVVTVTPIVYGKDLTTVSTYSNLFMYVLLFTGFTFYLLISKFRRQNLLSNRMLRVIFQVNFVNFFQKGEFLYTRIFVWFSYLWLVTIYILFDGLLGRSEAWMVLFSLIMSLVVSATLVSDIMQEYHEITTHEKKDYL